MSVVTQTTVDRAQALVKRIEGLDGDPARAEAVTLGLVDALLERDGETLAATLAALRAARARVEGDDAGWLDAAIAFAHWGSERVPANGSVALGTRAHDFLAALGESRELGSSELRQVLETDETQVSRTGRRLLEGGLVTRRKVGRQAFWRLSPRGQRVLDEAPAASAGSEFWREALRRGFDAAAGDEPGEPRPVDPTRERIIDAALGLHVTNGIQATTWPQIAEKAGVPVEAVESIFPTLDDLVRGCGGHFFETLGLPPQDRAREVFAGTSTEHERVHRLVETLFGTYERGADGITVARRERNDVPAANDSMTELENTFDALAGEALRPSRADSGSIATLRGLTELEVWRTIRAQGATPEAAVDEASAAVERWLAARPAR